MTALVCLNWIFGGVFLADARLSYAGTGGPGGTVRDICQKLWVPNGWCVLGFAGDLCLGNELAGTMYRELDGKRLTSQNVLTNGDELGDLIVRAVCSHPDTYGDEHAQCVAAGAALLIAHYTISTATSLDGRETERVVRLMTTTINSSGEIQRSGAGAAAIGEGADQIRPRLTGKLVEDIGNAPTPTLQSLFALHATARAVDEYQAKSVGLPFQVAHLSQTQVEVMPYFYWADVESGFGTYVAVRIENGFWIQEHRPSRTVRRMRQPADILNQELDEGKWPIWRAEILDPRRSMNRNSPGVIAKKNPTLVYAPYVPGNVPGDILESWGSEPIDLLTWASKER